METLKQWMGRETHRAGMIGRAGYFASVMLAGVLLLAGLVVYGSARMRGDGLLPGGWQDYLPIVAMAYGSLLLLAVAVIEVRVRHVRAGTLDRLIDNLTQCQEQERNDLSARLHDDVGALLTALKLELEGVERKGGVAEAEWVRVDALLVRLLDEVRGLSALLYPRMIGRVGLTYALEEMIRRICAGKLDVELDLGHGLDGLDPDRSLCVLRFVQEAVINACRHAQAHRITVSVGCEAGALEGRVADDGRGWRDGDEGMGLTLMRERIRKYGGTLACERSAEGGACVRFEMPSASKLKRQARRPGAGRE